MAEESLPQRARRLTEPDAAPWPAELAGSSSADRIALAWAVKDLCIQAWSQEPQRTHRCAALLQALVSRGGGSEVAAAAAWCEGLAQLTRGQMESAMDWLDQAQQQLATLGQAQRAAQSQITKVMALAMLGRHDEALASGERTRHQLVAAGDEVGAGKVELNLGSMLLLRDRYPEAADQYRRAGVRFARADDATHSIMADIGLAGALASQFDFDEALRLYDRASMRTRARQLSTLEGVIDTNRGRLELHRGRLERALQSFEAALREAELDGTPQDVAEAQRDMADIYLALNLLPEAVALYDQTIASCEHLNEPTQRAWASVQRSVAISRLGDTEQAALGLRTARQLFAAADNEVGVALTDTRSAMLDLGLDNAEAALARANAAAVALWAAGVDSWACQADTVAAEAFVALGRLDEAQARYRSALHAAQDLPALQTACHTGLGLLLQRQGHRDDARAQYEQAIRSASLQRAALPGDEFRAAYGADKQRPYDELIALALDDDDAGAALRLWQRLEEARAPALRTALQRRDNAPGMDPAHREQLRWLHGQWQRAITEGELERAGQFQARSRELERSWLEQYRRSQAAAGPGAPGLATADDAVFPVQDVAALCAQMPPDTALVVFGLSGERIAACVLTRQGLRRVVSPVQDLQVRLEQLRFQIDTLRFGAPALRPHAAQMAQRARSHLQALHAIVWQPLATLVKDCTRLVIVPHRKLHYLPFCALHDGRQGLLERHEISVTPSALDWLAGQAAAAGAAPLRRVAALGVGGSTLPHVQAEVDAVARVFSGHPGGSAAVRLDRAATLASLREVLPGADVLHLACHGQFRADSPYFSALHLADGALTVHDAAALPLHTGLVTLSACETGLSRVAPGDEQLGLLRGFLMAGAPRVLATQWTVDDAGTAQLMSVFYGQVLAGQRPAAALRTAQRSLAKERPHPYFWAPFTLHERA